MDSENDILFDAYLGNELNADERVTFEGRLTSDANFRAAFELHRQVLGGIISYGNGELKKELKQIYTENKPAIDQQQYRPSIGHGFNLYKWIFRLFSLSVIGFLVSSILIVVNKFPVHNQTTESYKNWLITTTHKVIVREKIDTVYYTIESVKVPKGDTIVSFPDKKIHISKNGKRDTIVTRFKMSVKKDTNKAGVESEYNGGQ